METSLHRQLKALYCGEIAQQEVQVQGYRIDAVVDGQLIEIQQASLAALRRKTRELLEQHSVTVVKPLAARKVIHRCAAKKPKGGTVPAIESSRASPKHETIFDLFIDLVHFVDVFPHPRLTLEVLLTEQEEFRVKKRRRWFRAKDYRLLDRRLTAVRERRVFRTTADLLALLPRGLAAEFTTAEIALGLDIPRWLAQKMAYCLRRTGALFTSGKRRNSLVYSFVPPDRAAA